MLVLSRKLNETIVIDGNIRLTVVGIRGNQVRIGIEAPTSVKIFRQELVVPVHASQESEGPRDESSARFTTDAVVVGQVSAW
ncbi:MAG: carbon storage regulator CsrA [Planctomycetaceae bacterium]|nr:carbon storage regulator CsrA [Planctomycetaceae bacterium]MBV8265987.1 carbon storage regulator CsrA [Planctomycetaceae bacterium]MBV8316971.1 carbon storage regulator CsrA [Planctomycetaceae bacterium]